MTWRGTTLLPGAARGEVLRFDAPISFWGGIDPTSSKVTLANHPQIGQPIAGKILVIPELIGSSSSSSILLELLYKNKGPIALVLGAPDAILPVGAVVSRQMGWPAIPVVVLPDPPFQTGQILSIAHDGLIESS